MNYLKGGNPPQQAQRQLHPQIGAMPSGLPAQVQPQLAPQGQGQTPVPAQQALPSAKAMLRQKVAQAMRQQPSQGLLSIAQTMTRRG